MITVHFLNEWGDYTPAYHEIREILCAYQGIEMTELPESQSFGQSVMLN